MNTSLCFSQLSGDGCRRKISFSIEKLWGISLVLIITEQWFESCILTCVDQITMNLDRDTEIQSLWCWQIIDANMTIVTVYLEILLRVYLQHCFLVCITKHWLLSVLMFCNVDGNDLGALHYLNSWLGLWRGAFPPSCQLNSEPIRREDWDTPTNQSPGLAQVVGAGVGWGQFSWTLRPGCEVWTENFVFSFRPIWCRMFVACCKVNYRV